MKRARRLLRVIVAAVLVAGCIPLAQAYSDHNKPVTTGFSAEAGAACTKASKVTRSMPKVTSTNLPTTLTRLTAVFQTLRTDLAAVSAPSDKRAAYRAYVASVAEQGRQLSVASRALQNVGTTGRPVTAGAALDRFDDDATSSESTASHLGLGSCAKGLSMRQ